MTEARIVDAAEGGRVLAVSAGVPLDTAEPKVAYASFTLQKCAYEKGWLPE